MLNPNLLRENAKSLNFNLDTKENKRLIILSEITTANRASFAEDVQKGLLNQPKFLLPKYFYDSYGSELFIKITQTTEYYPTKVEKLILKTYASEMVSICKKVDVLVELGSGSSEKTETILKQFHQNRGTFQYIPVDVSDIIIESSKDLLERYDNLYITSIISEYEKGLELVSNLERKGKLFLFLGSSIGNFNPSEIEAFLKSVRNAMQADDFLLIGFDLVKDHHVLNAAYNDSQGITREFNLNILRRINMELNANFDLSKFIHSAFYNEEKSRVEMHLVSQQDQLIRIDKLDKKIKFKKGESIHTENSYKFTDMMIYSYAQRAGLEALKMWTDPQNYFALTLFRPANTTYSS